MIDKFIVEYKMAAKSDPMMQRWLYGFQELQRLTANRLINLCKYQDMIPDSILNSYSDVLLIALLGKHVLNSDVLEGITIIISRLIKLNMIEKANKLKKYV